MENGKIEIPIALQWKITNIEIKEGLQENKLLTKEIEYEELENIRYGICFILDNENFKNLILIGIYIMMEPPMVINAKWKISISSANYYYEMETCFNRCQSYGKVLCSADDFFDPVNNYFIDDNVIILMEGLLSFEKEQQQTYPNCAIKSSLNLGEILWTRDDKDFNILVAGQVVQVHKCVIATKSSVFEKMFQPCWKEAKENQVKIIDFDFDTVEIAMKFCYGIEITQFLSVSNGIKLLQFSDKYNMDDLKNAMEVYLFNQKYPMNIVEIANAAIFSNSFKLRENCFNYLIERKQASIFIKGLENLEQEFFETLLKTCINSV